MHQGELWQEYDQAGIPLASAGREPTLGNPKSGESTYVSNAIVWLYRKTDQGLEVLFQKRSQKVDRNAGKWDVAAGGHININESIVDAAIREAKEEIGATINRDHLKLVVTTPSLFANLIMHEFICDYTGQPDDFHFNDEEVSEVKWVPISEFDDFIDQYAKDPLKEDIEIRSLIKKHIMAYGNH